MKKLHQLLLLSLLAVAAMTLTASRAEAVRRRPILQQHLQHGSWHRGGPRTQDFRDCGPKAKAASVPELDATAGASALALLGALAVLSRSRREETLALAD